MATWRISSIAVSTIEEKELKYHEQIGRGATGEVYRVTWSSKDFGDIEAAAKKIFRDKDKSIEKQFGDEIKFLRELTHPNIVKYYGHVVTESHIVIVTEYAAKGSLYDYLKKQTRLPEDLKKKWRIQAAKGIRYLQENRIVHRDIKSLNFFITANDDLKIGDFGIAKVLTTTTSTETGRGTIRWQAPEIFKDYQVSPKADIFALGVVLWELETCEEPYRQLKLQEQVMWAVGKDDERPEIPVTCPSALRLLIQQCWHKDRSKRPHIDDVVSRLCDINKEPEGAEEHQLEECEESFANMHWHLRSEMAIESRCCHWITEKRLAVAMSSPRIIKLYELSDDELRFCDQIKTTHNAGKIMGMSVSESIPDRLLVIHDYSPSIFQYPCHNAREPVKQQKFHGDIFRLAYFGYQIVTNAATAVVRWAAGLDQLVKSLVILNLPDFNDEKLVEFPKFLHIEHISINSKYLLVQGQKAIEIRSVNSLESTLMWIDPPSFFERDHHALLVSSAFSGRNTYIVSSSRDEERVFIDILLWSSDVKPQYTRVKHTWAIDMPKSYPRSAFHFSSLSEGLLAVRYLEGVKVYHPMKGKSSASSYHVQHTSGISALTTGIVAREVP